MELSRLDISDIQKQVNYFLQLGPLFECACLQNSLWVSVHLEVRRFDDILPILSCVIDPDIQNRLHKLLKEEINIHSITLEELIRLDLLPKKDRILQVSLFANNTRQISSTTYRIIMFGISIADCFVIGYSRWNHIPGIN